MCTPSHYQCCWKNMFRERKRGGAWCAHCPVIDTAEKTCFGRENGAACDVHTAPHITHRPVIDAAEKICLGRENGAVCDVHTTPLSTLLKKYVLGEKTGWCVMCTPPLSTLLKKHVSGEKMGWCVMCTLPCYQCHWKSMSWKRKWGGMWCAHCPIIDAAEKICFGRENGAACDVHTALLLTPWKGAPNRY